MNRKEKLSQYVHTLDAEKALFELLEFLEIDIYQITDEYSQMISYEFEKRADELMGIDPIRVPSGKDFDSEMWPTPAVS